MITVCSITGVDPIGHMEAIERTQLAIPHYTKMEFRFIPGMDLAGYSEFMVKKLGSLISTEYVLICQADGFGRNIENWTDDFLDYDYVGACWNFPPFVGNGGVSLRSKKLLELCAQLPDPDSPEDIFICCQHRDLLEAMGVRFAPVELAKRFSFEHPVDFDPQWTSDRSWAVHGKHHLQNETLGL